MSTLLVVVIVLAIAFDYINGFHDAANSIATVVATRLLGPELLYLLLPRTPPAQRLAPCPSYAALP